MKYWIVGLTLFALVATGCKHNEPPPPQADAHALFHYLTQTTDYTDWSHWPHKEALYPGQYPHGAFLTTYVNSVALGAIETQQGQLPQGSIIIKECYSANKQLTAISVMYKTTTTNDNNYFWIEYQPDGQVLHQSDSESCTNCHSAVRDNDWLFTGVITKREKTLN